MKKKEVKAKESLSLRFLYRTLLGRLILKLLVARWISKLAGKYLSSKCSRHLIKGFVKKNGIFLAMKASQGENEATAAANAIKTCGGGEAVIVKTSLVSLGNAAEPRIIVKIKKTANTPQKYPRHYSQISKKPL